MKKQQKKNRNLLGSILGYLGLLLIVLLIAGGIIYKNELKTLASLKKTDDYGAYQMTYYGDYGFDDFLEIGASSDEDIEQFVTKRLLKGLPIDLGITGAGCTAFVVKNENGETLYGRNFDFTYAPSMQLYTKPDHGYASISTVNLSFAGYSENNLPEGNLFQKFLTLAAPYLPFDGMNEKGVAMALLAVPEAEPPYKENGIMLNTTTAIRLVLDRAATVEEAVELLRQYNIYFSGDIPCHYLIADASGHSVIVEYYNHEFQVVNTDQDYQIASNFIANHGINIGEGFTEFERYDTVEAAILKNNGLMNEDEIVNVLNEVGVKVKDTDKLQWSVIYNLTTGNIKWFAHRNTQNIIENQLKMTNSDDMK